LIEQFDGYFERQGVDLKAYADRTASMQALLGIEGVNQTQVLKQPDVLMLFYLLPEAFDEKTVRVNYDYYTPRTDHTFGSSLGPAIQSIMACRLGELEDAYEHFMRAAHADLYDVRGNSGDGIHGASAGGLWQAVVFGFAGLRITPEGWSVNPRLPNGWKRVTFKFYYHGHLQEVDVINNP
jgi:kojibiose phosphorylase